MIFFLVDEVYINPSRAKLTQVYTQNFFEKRKFCPIIKF